MPALRLYDLAGADPDRRFSPFCWRAKLALAHKELAVETLPWRFTDKDEIAFSGQGRVPVLVDGDTTVIDSWAIAVHLETHYPDRPSLFGGDIGMSVTRFLNAWTDKVLHPALAPLVISDIHAHVAPQDMEYFRTTREKAFGKPLEEVSAGRDEAVLTFRRTLEPLRAVLQLQPYLAGTHPAYADYIVFGAFQWARCISPFKMLADDDAVAAWRLRMLNAFNGLAGSAPRYPV